MITHDTCSTFSFWKRMSDSIRKSRFLLSFSRQDPRPSSNHVPSFQVNLRWYSCSVTASQGFGIRYQPGCVLLFPLPEFCEGERVAQTEGDELIDISLLPVGELLSVFLDVPVRVEEVGRHSGMIEGIDRRSMRVGRSPTPLMGESTLAKAPILAPPGLPLPWLARASGSALGRHGGRRYW